MLIKILRIFVLKFEVFPEAFYDEMGIICLQNHIIFMLQKRLYFTC